MAESWNEITDDIRKKIRTNHESQGFFTNEDVQVIWPKSTLRALRTNGYPWRKDNPPTLDMLQKRVKILSILIEIQCPNQQWKLFDSLFKSQEREDKRLPFEKSMLHTFLEKGMVDEFFKKQWSYLPKTIKQEGDIQKFNNGQLPFIKSRSKPQNAGGMSQSASLEVIRGEFYKDDRGHSPREILVFRKMVEYNPIHTKFDCPREIKTLIALSRTLTQSQLICRFLAIIECEISSSQTQVSILMPPADSDLHKCIFSRSYWGGTSITLRNILTEASTLMEGLDWLHREKLYGIGSRRSFAACCHMDLKPDNILVFSQNGCPLGRWKIADFGLSVIEPTKQKTGPIEDNELLAQLDRAEEFLWTIQTSAKMKPGPYTAPEVCMEEKFISRTSDIWSVGCIFVQLISLVMTEDLSTKSLNIARGTTKGGQQEHKEYTFFFQDGGLNPNIKHWIEKMSTAGVQGKLCDLDDRFALEDCQVILQKMLNADTSRPSAIAVQRTLQAALQKLPEKPEYKQPKLVFHSTTSIQHMEPSYQTSDIQVRTTFRDPTKQAVDRGLLIPIQKWLADDKRTVICIEQPSQLQESSAVGFGLLQALEHENMNLPTDQPPFLVVYHLCIKKDFAGGKGKNKSGLQVLLDLIQSMIWQLQNYFAAHPADEEAVTQQEFESLGRSTDAIDDLIGILKTLWDAVPCRWLCVIEEFDAIEHKPAPSKEQIGRLVDIVCPGSMKGPDRRRIQSQTLLTTIGGCQAVKALPHDVRKRAESLTLGVLSNACVFYRARAKELALGSGRELEIRKKI